MQSVLTRKRRWLSRLSGRSSRDDDAELVGTHGAEEAELRRAEDGLPPSGTPRTHDCDPARPPPATLLLRCTIVCCEWSKAARIVFSMSPNSASCERVFSLLKVMFGENRDSSLADMLQASLMLRYNKRRVG